MNRDTDIRSAQPDDLDSAIRLLAHAGLPTDDVSVERLALVAERNGCIAGLIGLEEFGSLGLLRSLVVDPDCRSGGLGRQLVAALEQVALKEGIAELWLLTIDADRFFEKLGYVRQQRSAAPAVISATGEFSSLCPGDAVLMKKAIRV